MSTTPMSLAQFGQLIKSKHPEYQDLGDEDLGNRVLAKFPQYKDMVQTGTQIPAPNSTGLANRALAGTGIQVSPMKAPNIPVTGDNPVIRAAVAAGATLPSGSERPILGQGKSPIQVMASQPLPFGSPSSAYEMVAEPARRAGGGDIAGAIGNVGGQLAQQYILKKIGEAAQSSIPESNLRQSPSPLNKVMPKSVEELTGTTPQRISELQSFPQKIEGIRQQVITAEKSAHQAASDAFPKFDKPIETGRMIEKPASGPIGVDDFGEIAPKALEPETTTFKALQEQRSTLLKDIAAEKRAINAGMKPRFDLEDMVGQLNEVDGLMEKAALDQGGQAGLDQLNTARVQYGKYMNDFHNAGSPLRKVLDAKQGEVGKIVGNFLSPDNGARALETLKQYGVDTSNIQSMLGQGERPLKVTAAESAKLRKAGSPEAYKIQRLRESLSQATTNELPSSAQARLPQSAMKSKYPLGVLNEIPGAEYLTPRKITELRLKAALKARGQKP